MYSVVSHDEKGSPASWVCLQAFVLIIAVLRYAFKPLC